MTVNLANCFKYVNGRAPLIGNFLGDFRFCACEWRLHSGDIGVIIQAGLDQHPFPGVVVSAVTKVLVEEDEVRSRLAELGLYSIEEIHAAFLESTQARSTCTGLDPVTLPGTYMSGVTVRALRRIGIPKGWKKKNQGGISLTVSPDKKLAVVVSTGTSGTGRKDGRPQTRSKKGKRMVDAISAAGFQYALIELLGPTAVKDPEPEIWVVLYRYRRVKDTDHKRVLIEISKPHPDGVNKRGRIVGWAERLVIPRLDIDGTPERKPEAGPQFDVSVVRRAT